MPQIQKDYSHAFLVEPTKLTRLLDLIHHGITGGSADIYVIYRFHVFLRKNRVDEFDSVDAVLALENSRKKKIQRISVLCSGGLLDGNPAAHDKQVEVDFGVVKRPNNSPENSMPTKQIAVTVRSDSPSWNSRMLSEVEEQVERTRLSHRSPILTLAGLIILMGVIVLLQIVRTQEDLSKQMWLDDAGLARVEQILSQNRTITDEEMREISTIQFRNLLLDRHPPQAPAVGRKLFFLGIPFVFLAACAIILITTSYPNAVFLWGDEKGRYDALINRRKILWGFIFTLMAIGLLSRFLYEGISSWLPK